MQDSFRNHLNDIQNSTDTILAISQRQAKLVEIMKEVEFHERFAKRNDKVRSLCSELFLLLTGSIMTIGFCHALDLFDFY